MERKVALVTGASSGFGMLAALALAKEGYEVIAGVRQQQKAEALLSEAANAGVEDRLTVRLLDVTNSQHIALCKDEAASRFGHLDVLVSNAGFALGGAVEELSMVDLRSVMETNFFAAAAVTKAFVPLMRTTGRGHIIMIGSISGRFGFPGYSAYAASKFALEGFSESLRYELAPFGVHVSILEPGSYRTSIWEKGLSMIRLHPNSPYHSQMERLIAYTKRSAAHSSDPPEIAALIVRISNQRKPRLRYAAGKGTKLALAAKAVLPHRLIEWIVNLALQR